MYALSRRALLLAAATRAAWPAAASAEPLATSAEAMRRLSLQVSGLTERFYRTAVECTPFADGAIARYARDLAADHGARLDRLATKSPATASTARGDWRSGLTSVVAAIGGPGAFDPFAGDAQFLLAAHVLESATADAHRLGAGRSSDLDEVAAEATYHAGLVRTALAATEAGQATAHRAEAATGLFAHLRGAPAKGGDPERRALRTLFLTHGPSMRGGFFPHGLHGSIRLSV